MELYVIRHAKAAPGESYADDADRPLTADGRRAALDVGAALARHGCKLDAVLVSPLVRAVETAELVAVATGFGGELEVDQVLSPRGTLPETIGLVRRLVTAGRRRAALVGHEPSLGRLLSVLLGRPGLELSKGAAARLEVPPAHGDGQASFSWVITPRRLDPLPSLDGL